MRKALRLAFAIAAAATLVACEGATKYECKKFNPSVKVFETTTCYN